MNRKILVEVKSRRELESRFSEDWSYLLNCLVSGFSFLVFSSNFLLRKEVVVLLWLVHPKY